MNGNEKDVQNGTEGEMNTLEPVAAAIVAGS